ncbi:alpha/beta fold hydrolase [Halovenus sp. WSH3]|uniref:Alpha/beta fold hydrolase n=1 Tax=Halovenus carboxidivorans TaxID=2692199 RepID=A0A6B0T7Q0_9EURY|nr:alpha/beta hydrolase [Halovenus carboxidivorans]MXR51322.1 alpha/beta fold hydrolase [Halovenus carboxidivorans]
MKLRNIVLGAAGAVGATALCNRVLESRAEEFEPYLDGDQGTYRWRGFGVSYTELGDPADDDLLLLHGTNAAASSHEYRAVVEDLSESYHLIVPDLPGYGHSDRPPLLYSASLYEAFVEDIVEDLTDDPTVVASSLSSSYAAAAARNVEMDRLICICPTDTSMGSRQVWLRALLRSPVIGTGLYNLIVSKPSLRYFNADHGYYDPDNVSEEVIDYEWTTGHQPGARFAPASFVSGFLNPEGSLEEHLSNTDVPTTFVWGRNADVTPLSEGRELAEHVGAGLVVVDQAKLLPHVEHPERFVEVVEGELDADEREQTEQA